MTTVHYVNKKGGCRSLECLKVAKKIWYFCETRRLFLTATHLPGILNEKADTLSRQFLHNVEWELDQEVLTLYAASGASLP